MWPSPSNRWRSFEAEPFSLTVYRYDRRSPSHIMGSGFGGYNHGIHPPNITFFGDDTVFSSGSIEGVKNFLNTDINVFADFPFEVARLKILGAANENVLSGLGNLNVPYLYRIRTDTHHIIPIKDFNDRYGDVFSVYNVKGGRSVSLETQLAFKENDESYKELFSSFEKTYTADNIENSKDKLGGMLYRSDEVHVKGPIHANPIMRQSGDRPLTSLGRDITHGGVRVGTYNGKYGGRHGGRFELDLATDLW